MTNYTKSELIKSSLGMITKGIDESTVAEYLISSFLVNDIADLMVKWVDNPKSRKETEKKLDKLVTLLKIKETSR